VGRSGAVRLPDLTRPAAAARVSAWCHRNHLAGQRYERLGQVAGDAESSALAFLSASKAYAKVGRHVDSIRCLHRYVQALPYLRATRGRNVAFLLLTDAHFRLAESARARRDLTTARLQYELSADTYRRSSAAADSKAGAMAALALYELSKLDFADFQAIKLAGDFRHVVTQRNTEGQDPGACCWQAHRPISSNTVSWQIVGYRRNVHGRRRGWSLLVTTFQCSKTLSARRCRLQGTLRRSSRSILVFSM